MAISEVVVYYCYRYLRFVSDKVKHYEFQGKTHRKFFERFPGKSSLTKNLKIISGVGGGGGNLGVFQPMFQDLCSKGNKNKFFIFFFLFFYFVPSLLYFTLSCLSLKSEFSLLYFGFQKQRKGAEVTQTHELGSTH